MKTLALAALLLLAVSANAADATVDDMAWLAGHWTGTGLGGHCTETWSPPDHGVMLGTFRLVREGKPVFYELLAVGMFDGKLAMRLKHFIKHTKTDGNTIEFEGLRFVREGNDKVTIYLKLRGKDGTVREETFEMQRS